MASPSFRRHLLSFFLPFFVDLVIPFLIVARFNPFRLTFHAVVVAVQVPLGIVLFLFGLSLLIVTIRLFAMIGKGTLAPWDATSKLVTAGVYGYTRNPMISGVAFMVLGETIFLASIPLLIWFAVIVAVNTIYFKLSEEPGLVKRFGQDYIEYRKNVPMWIPRARPWKPV